MTSLSKCRICLGDLRGSVVGHFSVCNQCGIHYNTVIPTKQALRQSLNGMMLTACSSKQKMQRRLDKAHQQLDIIDPHISARRHKYTPTKTWFDGKFYDVGAAGGFVMKAAYDKGWGVYGNELSQTAIAWAKRTYDISIFHGFLEDDPIAIASTFDLIVFWNTLEHMIDPIATLAFATRMLGPQGHLHIRVPIKTGADMVKFHEVGHMVEFGERSLKLLRRMNGLEEVTKSYPDSRIPCVDLLWRKP